MNNLAIQSEAALIEQVLIKGDLSKLSESQRVQYYRSVCQSMGLNPLTKPFEYIVLNGKLTLYAKRDATDQLRKKFNVSIRITSREQIGDVYVVTAQATFPDGRCDESTGAVTIKALTGDNLANAYLKSETKAKRRVTLSICGLGLLDETEVETIKDAKPLNHAPALGTLRANDLREAMAPLSTEVEEFSNPSAEVERFLAEDMGEKIISVGKKYKGQPFKKLTISEIQNYCQYFEGSSARDGKPLSPEVQGFIEDAYRYLEQQGAL